MAQVLIEPDTVMRPFACEVLSHLAPEDQPIVLIMDQSKLNDRHQVIISRQNLVTAEPFL